MTDKIKLPRIDANKIFINGVELNANHIKNNSIVDGETITEALDSIDSGKFNKSQVKQVIGTSTTDVMSQDAASKNFLIDANNTSQRKVFVQNGTPTGMNVGDIWIKI